MGLIIHKKKSKLVLNEQNESYSFKKSESIMIHETCSHTGHTSFKMCFSVKSSN